ncbi:MAG: hypothetical protein CR982_02420 [Candidatus Cloacimonadota bacterium]|nr:MAG: hypothetical protein CR982_02420 [Candidatus Cloacimonadota bacterium]PIE78542.1 MAG: hypothetical protein CSA15_07560 [Candidatus Delongbacteria bacterium]
MKSSLKIVTIFMFGVFISFYIKNNFIVKTFSIVEEYDLTTYILYILMFLVGFGIGGDTKSWRVLKEFNIKIILVPIVIIAGSLLGGLLFGIITNSFTIKDSLAVSSGLGYYSLSSIIITESVGETLGTIALLSNILRELITLIFTPLMVKYFGKLAPIASGGATSMDTTLPIISKYVGKDYAVISIFSGTILTIAVPILVSIMV